MSKKFECPPVHAILGALSSAGATVYVRTPSPAGLAAVVDAVARLDDPPSVRVLAGHQPIAEWLRRSAPRTRELVDVGAVELRVSHAVVTDTTVVTEEGVARFGTGDPGATASGSRTFAESVYEAHARAWRRADPVAGGRRAASG